MVDSLSCWQLEGGARPLFPQWSHHVYPQFLPGSHPDASPPQNTNTNSMPSQNTNLNHNTHHQSVQQRNHQLIRNHINNKLDQAAPQLRFRRNMVKPGKRHLSGVSMLHIWHVFLPLRKKFSTTRLQYFIRVFLTLSSLHCC